MIIYSKDCLTCGLINSKRNMVKRWAKENNVAYEEKRTNYEQDTAIEALEILRNSGYKTDNYRAFVYFGGNNIILLTEATREKLDQYLT